MIAVIKIHDADYVIATYYGPNEDKTQCLEKFLDKVEEINISNIVMGGTSTLFFTPQNGGNYSTKFKCKDRILR